jgi:hypothetical protein
MVLMLFCWIVTCKMVLDKRQKIRTLSNDVFMLIGKAETLEKERAKKKMPLHFLKQKIESIPLLKAEQAHVAALAQQFPDNLSLQERLQFLESHQNQIHFETIGEKELHLNQRVQMDLSDLRKFLETVETDRYDATQEISPVVVKKFDLLKCYEKGDEKVYSIYVELLQK